MKKLLLLAILMFSLAGFSQVKVLFVHNTADSNGFEAIYDLDAWASKPHAYELGIGATGGPWFHTLYGIANQKVTKYFSVGAKLGAWSGARHSFDDCTRLYYGATSYLQLNGAEKGFVLGFGADNREHLTFGIGYKF